jgi:hypothetical protein
MGAMESNSSIGGTTESWHHIQNFREVMYNKNSKWGRTEARSSAGVGHNLRGQRPGTPGRALLGAGPAWLTPASTAHRSPSSAVFDNCPDVGVKHPTGSGQLGPKSMSKPNDAKQPRVRDAILKTKFSTSDSTTIRHFEIKTPKIFWRGGIGEGHPSISAPSAPRFSRLWRSSQCSGFSVGSVGSPMTSISVLGVVCIHTSVTDIIIERQRDRQTCLLFTAVLHLP